jgi:hypothetical protein
MFISNKFPRTNPITLCTVLAYENQDCRINSTFVDLLDLKSILYGVETLQKNSQVQRAREDGVYDIN